MTRRFLSFLFFALVLGGTSLYFMEKSTPGALVVKRFMPPSLKEPNIMSHHYGDRPVLEGGANISVKESEGKIFVNNYGHGGSGWTLAPGSAQYIIEELNKYNLPKDTKITVVGGGVAGLFTAYFLRLSDYTNIKIVAEKYNKLVSHVAGGLLAVSGFGNSGWDKDEKMIKITKNSFDFYLNIMNGKNNNFKDGVERITAYSSKEHPGLAFYSQQGLTRPPQKVKLDFDNGTKREMISYESLLVSPNYLMECLRQLLEKRGILFEKRKVSSLSEMESPVVINCTGLQGTELGQVEKGTMKPMRGHLLGLKSGIKRNDKNDEKICILQSGEKNSGIYGFYLDRSRKEEEKTGEKCVIGGTYYNPLMENAWDDEKVFQEVIDNMRNFFGLIEPLN